MEDGADDEAIRGGDRPDAPRGGGGGQRGGESHRVILARWQRTVAAPYAPSTLTRSSGTERPQGGGILGRISTNPVENRAKGAATHEREPAAPAHRDPRRAPHVVEPPDRRVDGPRGPGREDRRRRARLPASRA